MLNPTTTRVAQVTDGLVTASGTMRSIYPNVSFPKAISPEQAAADWNIYRIEHKAVGAYQKSVATEPYWQVDSVYDNQVVDMDVSERKAAMKAELRSKAEEARNSGVMVNGVLIDTSDTSQSRIANLVSDLEANGGTVTFTTIGDTDFEDVSLEQLSAIKTAVASHVKAAYANETTLNKAIKAATTIAELEAIDLDGGW